MLIPSVRSLPVAAAATICTATLIAQAAAQCPFVPQNFVCTKENVRKFDSNCKCFRCGEENGIRSYRCTETNWEFVCGESYRDDNARSINSYIIVGLVFVLVSLVLLGMLHLLARHLRADKADTKKAKTEGQPSRGYGKRLYQWVYYLFFSFMYKNDKKERRSLCDFWIAHCELLDCFWCCSNRKGRNDDWRPFYLRFMRLLATLSVGASLSIIFGSLDFDSRCSTNTKHLYCTSGLTEEGEVSTYCTDGSDDSLAMASAAVATAVTQLVNFVGSFAQGAGKPRTQLDKIAHGIWFVAAVVALPICYAVSSQLMHTQNLDSEQEDLRKQAIVLVIFVTWGQNQLVDLGKMPFAYWTNCLVMQCLPEPSLDEKSQSVQPTRRELAEPKYAPGPEENSNEDKLDAGDKVDSEKNVDGEDKVDAIVSPTIAQ